MAPPREKTPSSRLAFLDMTKGVLVILMVVYHSLNYTNQYHLGFRYLSFLPPSFILITGFLLSSVYSVRYRNGDRSLVSRLLIRGLKLIVLFTALNIVAQFVRSPAYGRSIGVGTFFERWRDIYFFGSERAAVFEVLLPIAYLLIVAPALIALANRRAFFLSAITVLLIATCTYLDQHNASVTNLNFIAAGLLGMLAGQVISNLERLGRHMWLLLLAYAVYFPLGVTKGYVYLVQLLGAVIALACVCAVSVRLGETGWSQRRIIRAGQYSLLAYIVQIGILQTLSRFTGRPDPLSPPALMLFTSTLLLMVLAIEITEWLRNRSLGADKLYKAAFA